MFYHLKQFCLLYPCTSQNEACPEQSENHFTKGLWVILYILFLHRSRVTTLHMAWYKLLWQQSWCNMSKVRPEYIIRIKIRAKSVFTKFGFWVHNFLPEASFGLRVLSLPASVCVCVRPCVNHELVRVITHHPFQLGSPNLDQRCKRPWLRSL